MMFRRWVPAFLAAGFALSCLPARAQDKPLSPEANQALKFVAGLRERGYHDIASDYLETLRKSPDTPADLKEILDYQDGRGLFDEATVTVDPDKKALLLDSARTKLDNFAKTHANHELAPDALIQLAKIYVERGHSVLLQSKELKGPEAQAKISAARASFGEARKAYDRAIPVIKTKLDRFPKFIPKEESGKIDAKKRAQETYQDALLQKTVVDYEEAQAWPEGSKERNEFLDKAIAAFEGIYRDYRTQLAGLSARMYQAKSYEEKGEYGSAKGIYDDLYAQTIRDPQFDEIRRTVGYYRIIVNGKRKDYAIAVDDARIWLSENSRQRLSLNVLGVKFELAKNILAQLDTFPDSDKEEAKRKATDQLNEVVRYGSPFKAEALELLRKYKPKTTLTAQQIAAMTYDNARKEADTAMQTQEWDRAIALLNHAIKRADPAKDPTKANAARYALAVSYFMSQRYYESAVLAEHIARRYPKAVDSEKAADLALSAHVMAYNAYNAIDRTSDLDRAIDLAQYTAATWPDTEQADTARDVMADIWMKQGKYAEAAKAFESIRPNSTRKLDAQVRAGDCHWRIKLDLDRKGKTAEATAEEKVAIELTSNAYETRKAAGTPPTDPGMITNCNALAELYLRTNRPKDALAILEPLDKALSGQTLSADVAPRYEGLLVVLMQAHLSAGQSNEAIKDMNALEKTGIDRGSLTSLYLTLSQTLKSEMDAQLARKDMGAYRQTQDAYKKFLVALAGSQTGQTFDSLLFAGEQMLALDMPKEASDIFDRIFKQYGKDPAYTKIDPKKGDPLLRLKVRQIEALRKTREFEKGLKLVDELIKANPTILDPMMEKGQLYEDWAKIDRKSDRWAASYDFWKRMMTIMSKQRPRRPEYFESIYHMAVALQGLGRKSDAAKILRGEMMLAPSVGKPEIKARYEALLKQLGP